MCGIFAYYEPSPYVSHGNGLKDVISGLLGQVNRGQEGVGIVAFTPSQDNVFRLEKTDLSIDRVLNDPVVFKKFQKLNGSIILGHNRYATHGSIGNMHAQPMQNDPNGELPKERRKAIIFNGNIANEPILREELKRKGYVFQTDTDTEVLLALITDIDKTLHEGKGDIQTDYSLLFKHLDQKIDGACSLVLIDGCGNIVFYRDKNGIRPLVMSKLDDGRIIAASETSVLDRYKGKIISLEPGQIFFYDRLKNQGKFIQVGKNFSHFCSNEILYLGRPESEINGRSFYSIRHKIGGLLAEIAREKFQALTEEQRQRILITPIPNTGIPYGIGMAEGLGAPYELALTVNNLRRSFINAADSRENILKDKHSPIKDLVKDKTIWCVDDTVIRSSTARVITKKLLEAGAGSVEWFVGAPMFKGTCHYGLSVPNLEDLIYWKAIDSLFLKNKGTPNENKLLEDEIATLIGAKSITFLTTDQILEAFPDIKENFCTACFDLKYPTAEGERLFLERKKQVSLSTVNSHQLKA